MSPEPTDGSPRPVVLVVDDEDAVRATLREYLRDAYEVLEAPDGPSALQVVKTRPVDLVLLDIRLPGMEGLEVLQRVKALDDAVEVVLVTAVKTVRTAVEAMKLGAYDYLTKPFDFEELGAVVRRAVERRALEREVLYLRGELARRHGFEDLVGQSGAMAKIYEVIAHVARTTVTVLVTGASGTGKELIARAVHRHGPRRERPFVAVNCAAIPAELLESELFGHERGAFTGAYARKPGKFELAHGGTLFLDEVGALRMDLQAKLLRALQEREIERVGGTHGVKVDVRIVAATNLDLRRVVAEGGFREDLFYRLNVVTIHIPPLRERRSDIPLLVRHFLAKYSREFGKPVRGLTKPALATLERYDWPGNVRELENVIERAVALTDGGVIAPRDLPLDLLVGRQGGGQAGTLRAARRQFEQQFILRALERADWNQTQTARVLGLHRNTLQAKIALLGLRRENPRGRGWQG